MTKLKNETGFTLLELLFVLMIVMLLVWVAFPALHKQYVKHEIDHFFRVFDSDILFIQNQTLEGRDLWIHLKRDHYIVKERNKNSIHTRHYPKHLGPQSFARHQIEYSNTGSVKNPYTYNFYDVNNKRYKVVFPFGKGRHYIE